MKRTKYIVFNSYLLLTALAALCWLAPVRALPLGATPGAAPHGWPPCTPGSLLEYENLNAPGHPGGCAIGSYGITDFAYPGITGGSNGGVADTAVRVTTISNPNAPGLVFEARWLPASDRTLSTSIKYVVQAQGSAPLLKGAKLEVRGRESGFPPSATKPGSPGFVSVLEYGCLASLAPCAPAHPPHFDNPQPFSLVILALPPFLPSGIPTRAAQRFPIAAATVYVIDAVAIQGGNSPIGPAIITAITNRFFK